MAFPFRLPRLLTFPWDLVSLSMVMLLAFIFLPDDMVPHFAFRPAVYDYPDYLKMNLPAVIEDKTFKVNSRRLMQNQVIGAEAFAFDGDYVYTGLADGRILKQKYTETDWEPHVFTRLHHQQPSYCDGIYYRVEKCGRPLGLKVRDGFLYVVDARFGLFRINLETKLTENILNDVPFLQDSKLVFYNSLAFDPIRPNLVYISITSTRWGIDQVPISLLEHENSGLLISYDMKAQTITKLAEGLYFANGIDISSDQRFLYIAQTTNFSIHRIALSEIHERIESPSSTDKLPNLEPFFTTLPGEPDNIVVHDGKVYVGFALARIDGRPSLLDALSKYPRLRRGFARYSFFSFKLFDHLYNFFAFDFLEWLRFHLYSMYFIYSELPLRTAFAILDESTGRLERLAITDEANFFSEVAPIPNTTEVLIGSFRNDFIIRANLAS